MIQSLGVILQLHAWHHVCMHAQQQMQTLVCLPLPIIGNNYNMPRFALVGHTYAMCSFLFSMKQLQFILATAFVVVCLFGGFACASGSTACIDTIRVSIDTLDKIEAGFKGTHHIVLTLYNGLSKCWN